MVNQGLVIESSQKPDLFQLDPNWLKDQLDQYGAIIFKGYDLNSEQFVQFTEKLGGQFLPYLAGAYSRQSVSADNTLVKVNSGEVKISLHGEQHYKKNKADLLWFYCVKPSPEGGETTICDGVEIYNALSDSTKKLFLTKKIKYTRWMADRFWPSIFKTDDLEKLKAICAEENLELKMNPDKSIVTEYVVSAIVPTRKGELAFINNLMVILLDQGSLPSLVKLFTTSEVSFDDGSPIPNDVIEELKNIAHELTLPLAWKEKEFCLIDNTRFMHGRNSFYGHPERSVLTRMAKLQ